MDHLMRCLLTSLALLFAGEAACAQPRSTAGAVMLLDFEADGLFAHLRVGNHTRIEPTNEAYAGKRAAKIHFAAVPPGVHDYPAVIVENQALKVRDFTPFEAISFWVKNPGPEDAELALAIWDKDGNRSFPIPSTVTIKPGNWQQIVSRLALHGLDAKQIGSLHFYQKANRRPITLLIAEVQLLSPYAGRVVAKIQQARVNLSRVRANAAALGAAATVEPKIVALSRRLDQLKDPANGSNVTSQKTQRLLELAQITAEVQELVTAIVIRNEGKNVRLAGPPVEAHWLSNPAKIRSIVNLNLADTPLRDEALSYLASAQDLQVLSINGKGITGAGLEHVASAKLRTLFMGNTSAHDDALKHVGRFRQLREIQLPQSNVTAGVLKHFVDCGQLKTLGLGGTGVADAGFADIAKLTTLESLDLENTKITGASLRHLENLTRLKSLDLRHTKIDDEGLSYLGKLTQLESLLLEDTPITGASFGQLKSLRRLVSLNLNNTRIGDSALRQLGELRALKGLELSSTRITDASLHQIAPSAALEYLDLFGTNITDAGLAALENQRNLKELYLGGTQVSDTGISYLKKLVQLEQLDLEGTQITDASLQYLQGMAKLAGLKLGKTRISGVGLAHLMGMSKLTVLDLSGTSVTDNSLGSLAGLENLQRLLLSGTRITSKGMRSLQGAGRLIELHLEATAVGDEGLEFLAALPTLQRLNLNETAVTDAGLKHLKQEENLRSLSLNHTRVTDKGLVHLHDRYGSLELTHTRITDLGVEQLQRNDQLGQLRLASTGITNDALKLLQATPHLRQLDLAETKITDAGLQHLSLLPDLQKLNLNGTRISDAGVDSLLKLPSLKRLALENARVTSQGASYLKYRRPELVLDLVFPWVWGERWSYYSVAAERTKPISPAIGARVKDLSSLAYFHVDDASLTSEVLRSLKDIPTLEHLSFQGTRISDQQLAELLGLSQVARLDLSQTLITDQGLSHLADMQGLRELNLASTRVTGSGLVHLEKLSRLQVLNLQGTPLDDAGLARLVKLKELRKLELGGTRLSDRSMEFLCQLPKLEYVDLYGIALTDAGLSQLTRLASLRYCYLSNTAITDSGIDHLRQLAELEELALDGTALTDHGLTGVRSLTNLRRLRIGRTKVTDVGLAHVAALPNLTQLDTNDLPLTSAGIQALQSLSKLQALNLSGTPITDESLATLAKFPALAELNLFDTSLTAAAVERFQREHRGIKVTFGITPSSYSAWSIGILVVYGLAVVAICFYGIHRYWLAILLVCDKHARTAVEPKSRFAVLPAITVQLPMFNERHVAERIIEATCALDYPRDRLQIQVLDDSTDESADIARRCCERMASAGHCVDYLHRSARNGFKGGALAAGLQSASGEFIAVFDADFVPPADILQQIIHHFTDSTVGMVQAEWSHLNRQESLLTQCQALFLDGHFVVEQTTRSRHRRWFNFNGTAGVWRKSCIEDAGGWQHDTLTEDTDLSYRAQLNGWKFLYLPTVRCPAELPSTMTAFLGQQHRWTKGLIQTGKKLLPRILRSSAGWTVKLEAWFHLTSPLMYLVMFIVTAIALPALFLATPLTHRHDLALSLGLGTLGLGTFAAATFYVASQRAQGLSLGTTLLRLPVLMALGIGMSAVNARAVLEALFGFQSPFVRTPKFGGRADCQPDPGVSRRRWRIPTGLLELFLAGVLFACLVLSFLRPYTLIGAPFLLLFALGYAGVGFLSLLDRYGSTEIQTHPAARASLKPRRARLAIGTLALALLVSVSGMTLVIASTPEIWAKSGRHESASLGLDLTTADWQVVEPAQVTAEPKSAIKRVFVDRGSLVLNVQLDEKSEQGELILDLAGAMQPLGESLGTGRLLSFRVEFPARFTGEFQAFVQDRHNRREYGSLEFIESHDARRMVTVSLRPGPRIPPMGYKDKGFDPGQGIQRIGLKISAQSDRVRGSGYRPFRGTIRVAKVRIGDVDHDVYPEPEIRIVDKRQRQPLAVVTAGEFRAASGVDRPWPIAYGFSGPLTAVHRAELERTYAAIAGMGCRFTRVYLGDYRTGLIIDGKGRVTGVEADFLEYLDQLAEIANRQGITVMFSLTDNTMADGKGLESVELLREGEESEWFIQKVLVEFVKKLRGRHVIWDLFNEPENVTALPLRDIQRYVERALEAGRRADPDARFTVVSRSRPEIIYWQGRGLNLYSHNIFTDRALEEAVTELPMLDAPIMVAEMAPQFATATSLDALRKAGYSGVGIWGWGTGDKYRWDATDLARMVKPLIQNADHEAKDDESRKAPH